MGSTEPLSRERYKSIGPYSTKDLHKNKHGMAYTTIGDPYDRSKRDRNPRWSEFVRAALLVFWIGLGQGPLPRVVFTKSHKYAHTHTRARTHAYFHASCVFARPTHHAPVVSQTARSLPRPP